MSKDTIKRLMKYVGNLDEALDLIDEFKVKPRPSSKAAETVTKEKPEKKARAKTKKTKKKNAKHAPRVNANNIVPGSRSEMIVKVLQTHPNLTVAEMVEKCGEESNNVTQTRYAAAAGHLTEKKVLIRKKNEEGKFVYRKRAGLVQL